MKVWLPWRADSYGYPCETSTDPRAEPHHRGRVKDRDARQYYLDATIEMMLTLSLTMPVSQGRFHIKDCVPVFL